jgi:GH18 family chitinase/predicted TIM-barrel fold metal-dependent hydrolase
MIFLIIIVISGQVLGQNKEVIGCYQSWNWQKSPESLDPQNIPYDKLTMIYYSFFYPLESGEIVGMDPAADRFLLQGKTDLLTTKIEPGKSIIELAKPHGTNVILSIGGWTTSNNFPQVSADPQKRANFAHWCVKHIQQYGFDGIDIDWEFPGYKRHNGTPQDRDNFALLLQAVRDSLQMLGTKSGKDYLLTASLPAAASHLPDIGVQKITPIVDYINIMTYDLFTPGRGISNHNSALYGPAQGDSARCLDGAFKLYHEQYNVPSEKITLCAAFFGYAYTNCTEMYGEHQRAENSLFKSGGDLLYSQIAEKRDLFERHWDPKAQAPYLISKEHKMLISLDDEESVALKAEYVMKNDAAGIIIWPLMGDYLKNGKTPLVDAIYQKFSNDIGEIENMSKEFYSLDDFKSVKKFDFHIHINTDETFFIDQAKDDNFRFLDIVDDRPFGLPMREQQKFAILDLNKFPDLMAFATTFTVDEFNKKDWVENTIADLKKSISSGAKMVKIWKNIGMDLRDQNGKFVMVNDPKLDPVIDYLVENHIPIIGHNGEPRDCWLPLEEMTFSKGYYGSHPEYHMYLHPEFPSYEDQINARDNMLEKHPDLIFVGAHLASLEWSLDELAKRLDKFPNMSVDLSRMSNLQLHTLNNRQKTREFFIKYQDRLLYATDTGINATDDPERLKKRVHDRWVREWKFFVSDESMDLRGFGEFSGLKLPREVIDKIYLTNALKILGLPK